MTGFDERKLAWEHKIKQDSDFRFKVEMRRNKLLGQWAAGNMGMNSSEVEVYVAQVIKSDFEEAGDDDVVRKILADFQAKNLDLDEAAIRTQLEIDNAAAAEQIMAGE